MLWKLTGSYDSSKNSYFSVYSEIFPRKIQESVRLIHRIFSGGSRGDLLPKSFRGYPGGGEFTLLKHIEVSKSRQQELYSLEAELPLYSVQGQVVFSNDGSAANFDGLAVVLTNVQDGSEHVFKYRNYFDLGDIVSSNLDNNYKTMVEKAKELRPRNWECPAGVPF